MDEARRQALAAWLRRPRYELMPLAGVEDLVASHVAPEVTLTVTAPATRGLEPALALTERLAGRGYRVVPHLSARLVRDDAHLAEVLPARSRRGWRGSGAAA